MPTSRSKQQTPTVSHEPARPADAYTERMRRLYLLLRIQSEKKTVVPDAEEKLRRFLDGLEPYSAPVAPQKRAVNER